VKKELILLIGFAGITLAADSDGDGLDDSVETNTGFFVDANNTGTDPNNADTDNDGINDGIEVQMLKTDPLEDSIVDAFWFNELLADFDGNDINYTTSSILEGKPGEIQSGGPTGDYYRLLFEQIDRTSNYLAFDAVDVSGWSTATLSFDIHASDVLGDGFSINFLDVGAHGTQGYSQGGSNEWTPGISNSIGIGFTTWQALNASVYHSGQTSAQSPYSLPNDVWGRMSITIDKNEQGLGTLTAISSFNGQSETIFNDYNLGIVNIDDFRIQFRGATRGLAMTLDLDNVRLRTDTTGEEKLPNFQDYYTALPNQIKTINGSVVTENPSAYYYQWFLNDQIIAIEDGGRNPELVLEGAADEQGEWQLLISDGNKVVSKRFTYALITPPTLSIDTFYESIENEDLIIDAASPSNQLSQTTYQWYFNGFPIPENFGGNASLITIQGIEGSNGQWKVVATNDLGVTEASFDYRVFQDADLDGLSDGYEEFVTNTDPSKRDTDGDGLDDNQEVNTHKTNPNLADSDSDGFTDLYELETAYDPNSADSAPDAKVNIMTAIEVNFNAALGATYAIEFSTDSQNWTVIEDNIIGEGAAVERLYSRKDYPVGFFRVERRDQ